MDQRSALQLSRSRSAQVPPSLTGFVGRVHERAALVGLLRDPDIRLLTITGPGGVGKTRLAAETVSDLGDAFPDGIVYVPLASTADPDRLLVVIAQAMALDPSTGVSVDEALHAALRGKRSLLLLDNMEHLLPAGPAVTSLLTTLPDLTIVATSRSRLDLSGEHVYTLEALSSEDARALFIQRAGALHAGRPTSTGHDPTVINAVCDHLDRLPLAIELAAARTVTLSPDALLERLSLSLLGHGPRNVPRRHQSMRDTIAWSYDLLDPDRQEGFRRLAVFLGGFTVDSAQAILGADADALDLLDFLVAHSLIVIMPTETAATRFTMLETIRQFGVEMLAASGDEEVIRRSHADILIDRIEHEAALFEGPDIDSTLIDLYADLDNVRAALRWTIAIQDGERACRLAGGAWRLFRSTREPWLTSKTRVAFLDEGRQWLGRALAFRHAVDSRHLLQPLMGYVVLLGMNADVTAADPWIDELMVRAREVGELQVECMAHLTAGYSANRQHDIARARRAYAAALALAEQLGCPDPLMGNIHSSIGQLELGCGNLLEAEHALCLASDYDARSQNPVAIADSACMLAMVNLRLARLTKAAHFALTAIRSVEPLVEYAIFHRVALIFATVARELGQHRDAATLMAFAANTPPATWVEEINEVRLGPFRESLSTAEFAEAWTIGERMAPEDLRTMADRLTTALDGHDSGTASHAELTKSILTARQLEVLRLLAAGDANRAIADALFLSERTVEKHVFHIMTRLGIDSRTGVVAWAVRNGYA